MNPINASIARDILQRMCAAVNHHDVEAVAALCCGGLLWAQPFALNNPPFE